MQETLAKINHHELKAFCKDLFCAVGMPSEDANVSAESIIQANLRGVDTHGVVRIPIYIRRIEKGSINKKPEIKVEKRAPGIIIVDGDYGLGHVVAFKAIKEGIDAARENGVACTVVRRSGHFGCAGRYAIEAADKGMISLILTNGPPMMAVTGSKVPFLGTNPLAVGIPTGNKRPIILDFATSSVANGKIILAAQEGKSIPSGWALGPDGNPTTDPVAALKGVLLPMAGHKGYGLALIIDYLSTLLSGASYGYNLADMYKNPDKPQNVGHFIITLDVSKFMPLEEFFTHIARRSKEVKDLPKQPGVEEIFLPGEIEWNSYERRKKEGIPLTAANILELQEIGQKYGLKLKI